MPGKLTDAEIAALPPVKRAQTLAKRKQRARAKGQPPPFGSENIKSLPMPAAPPPETSDVIRNCDLYKRLRRRLEAANMWNGDPTDGLLVDYVQASALIDLRGIDMLPPHVVATKAKRYEMLRLADLPKERERAGSERFGAGW